MTHITIQIKYEEHHNLGKATGLLKAVINNRVFYANSKDELRDAIEAWMCLAGVSPQPAADESSSADETTQTEAAIARVIVTACLQATHDVTKIGIYAWTTLPTRDSVSFYEGDPSNPDCFWFDNERMITTVTESIRDSKVSRRQIGDLLRKCGINYRRTPSHWGAGRKRYRQATRSSFSLLCHLGGVQFQMRTYQSTQLDDQQT